MYYHPFSTLYKAYAQISLLCAGEIPTSLFTLPALQYLDLSWNQLSGPIHEFEGVSSRIQMNEMTGQIPQSLLVLPKLTHFDIEGNNSMGLVDLASLLWRLENLTYLDLSHNKLTVTEGEGSNSSFTYPSRLMGLALASCNMTKILNLLMHLNHMYDLDLSSNNISGDIPNWIWNYDFRSLNLSQHVHRYRTQFITCYPIQWCLGCFRP